MGTRADRELGRFGEDPRATGGGELKRVHCVGVDDRKPSQDTIAVTRQCSNTNHIYRKDGCAVYLRLLFTQQVSTSVHARDRYSSHRPRLSRCCGPRSMGIPRHSHYSEIDHMINHGMICHSSGNSGFVFLCFRFFRIAREGGRGRVIESKTQHSE